MIPVCKPYWGREEEAAALRVMRSGRLVQGPEVEAFEDSVASYVEVKHAIACSSGTTALHLAMMGMGVGQKRNQVGPFNYAQKVLIPAFTFVATANAVLACGAQPVLCDIDLDTFNIKLTHGIDFDYIVPVHCFGVVSETYGPNVLEDAACALGSFRGLRGKAATLSFHATKTITTGEGGMVLTNDDDLADKCRFLRDQKHGRGMAYNYRMTEIQGAIGCEQMKRLSWILKRRAEIAFEYDMAFDVEIPATTPTVGNYQSYTLLLDKDCIRYQIQNDLGMRGIETLPGTQFLGDMPHLLTEGLPNARFAGSHAMRIPCYPGMTDSEVEQVIEAVKAVLG